MKVVIVIGTRPEIIKMNPVIRELEKNNIELVLIHSNQHYSENMDAVFFNELKIPQPKYNLNIGSNTHSNQTANILIKIEPILKAEAPDVVLVQGDTNTVMAAALAARQLGIKVGHVEAGLRSYDRSMPEESNRVITDHISDFLFAVSEIQKEILLKEGINENKIFVVGNTIVDAVIQNKDLAKTSGMLKKLDLTPKNYCLFTAHRASNVDNKSALEEILTLISNIPYKVCWPIHVRTHKKMTDFDLKIPKNVVLTEPLGYLDFLHLEENAAIVVTDSGGLQEEACILGIPCITIRENTERPETINVGSNILIGRDLNKLKNALDLPPRKWKNPFGDGSTSKKIVEVLKSHFSWNKKEKITVVGMGYMGLPTALLLADANYKVEGFDIDLMKVETLNQGKCPFDEEGLMGLLVSGLEKKNFQATNTISQSDIFIIAVPTPHVNGKCDLSYVLKACASVASVAKDYDVVIIESTSKIRTCSDFVLPFFKSKNLNVHVAYCPERAIPGNTLHELRSNDRIIGVTNNGVGEKIKQVYASFVTGEIFITNTATAEAVKLMENTYRDVNIALANEFSILGDELGFDVWEAIKLANRHPRVNILYPGPGVGGHCIAIDPWFLTEDSKSAKVIVAARQVNDSMPIKIVERLFKTYKNKNLKKITILGVAYKKNVDDARETPAEHIYTELISRGCEVKAHDPFVKEWIHPIEKDLQKCMDWAEAIILVTDHDLYKGLRIDKPFIDTRNLL